MKETEFAAAKINLCLHVTGQRADGYHLLDSLVAFAGVGDRLSVSPADEVTLRLEGEMAQDLKDEPDNIILKAARLLVPYRKSLLGAALVLEKTLPVASGIGGGSADAAAALRLLNAFWNLALPEEKLSELALSLGADVPVCVQGRPVRLRGIGEQLDLLPPLPPTWIVLVNPRISVSTPAVFKERREKEKTFGTGIPPVETWPNAEALAHFLAGCRNDLAAAAIRLAPAIATVLEELQQEDTCLLARMSGSGATCFGLFSGQEAAEAAARHLRLRHPEWWITDSFLQNK